jgi:hypothetical protein
LLIEDTSTMLVLRTGWLGASIMLVSVFESNLKAN